MRRRDFLAGALIPAVAAAQNATGQPQPAPRIYLDEYQPKSALVIAEHRVQRARFPLIDVHTPVSHIFGAQIFGAGAQSGVAKFFEDFQDRIMFGNDAQAGIGPGLYGPYFRFFETLNEYFDYSSAPIPTQGRWNIYGVGLPDAILKKVYHNNAARMLGLAEV